MDYKKMEQLEKMFNDMNDEQKHQYLLNEYDRLIDGKEQTPIPDNNDDWGQSYFPGYDPSYDLFSETEMKNNDEDDSIRNNSFIQTANDMAEGIYDGMFGGVHRSVLGGINGIVYGIGDMITGRGDGTFGGGYSRGYDQSYQQSLADNRLAQERSPSAYNIGEKLGDAAKDGLLAKFAGGKSKNILPSYKPEVGIKTLQRPAKRYVTRRNMPAYWRKMYY